VLSKHSPLDTDGEDEPGLGGDVERSVAFRSTLSLDDIALCLAVLCGVLLGTIEEDGALLFVGLRES
jgi:hypothetical protein